MNRLRASGYAGRARVFVVVGISAALLAGCGTSGPASVKGGECRIFEAPKYVVLGKRQYDQDWIDGNIEGGVGGCNWQRPKPRPAALDAVQGQRLAPAQAKKRGLLKRIRDRVVHPFAAPPAPAAPSPPVVAEPASQPMIAPPPIPRDDVKPLPPPPKPRDPVDELLHPGKN